MSPDPEPPPGQPPARRAMPLTAIPSRWQLENLDVGQLVGLIRRTLAILRDRSPGAAWDVTRIFAEQVRSLPSEPRPGPHGHQEPRP